MLTATNQYGRYAVHESSAHRPAAKAALRGDVWEPDTVALIRERCGTGDVVHAGTYFGDFLPGISSALAPGSLLWAFEPSPTNADAARETIRMNALHNAVLIEMALGEGVGAATLATQDRNGNDIGGLSRIVAGSVPNVAMTSIDTIVPRERHVSVVQLDVEGYEEPALCGAIRTISRCLPLLILEEWTSGQYDASEWFRENIQALGYVRRENVHENSVYEVE